MKTATLADLKKLVFDVLSENSDKDFRNENIRMIIAETVQERYISLVKIIATTMLEKEASKRSTLSTYQELLKK